MMVGRAIRISSRLVRKYSTFPLCMSMNQGELLVCPLSDNSRQLKFQGGGLRKGTESQPTDEVGDWWE